MSLRGVGTRYVPVGNIFSGLFCPVHEDKISEPLVIRAPQSRVPLSMRKDGPKNWRDSKTLVEKQRGLKKRIESIRPHIVQTEQSNALIVSGMGLFEWAQTSSEAFYREEDSKAKRQAEEVYDASLADANEKVTDGEQKIVEDEKMSTSIQASDFRGPRLNVNVSGQESVTGDATSSQPLRLLLHCDVGKEMLRTITVQNTGSTAIFVDLKRQIPNVNRTAALRSDLSKFGRVYCHLKDGKTVVLPSQSVDVPFSFRSNVAGVFSEEWHLRFTPEPKNYGANPALLCIKAVATEEDTGSTRRASLEKKLHFSAEQRLAEEARQAAQKRALEQKVPILSAEEKEYEQFTSLNARWFAGLPIHYSNTTFGEFKFLYNSMPHNSESIEWNGSLAKLADTIKRSASNSLQMRADMKLLEQKSLTCLPSNSSASWNAAFELLMSVALSIPDISNQLRADNGLEVPEIWKRPRNLKGGKRAVVPMDRRSEQLCLAWRKDSSDEEDSNKTPQQAYRTSLHTEVAKLLKDRLDNFVDKAMAAHSAQLLNLRKEKRMLLSNKLKPWMELNNDEDNDEAEDDEEKGADEKAGKPIEGASPQIRNMLEKIRNSRVFVRIDASCLKFDVDAGVRVLSDESVATELLVQHTTEAVQQLLDANAGSIVVAGSCDSAGNESFEPLANTLSESLDRPVRFVDSDEKAKSIIVEFEEKKRAKEEARVARERRIAERAAAAEAKRKAQESGGTNDEEDEDEEEEDDDDEDDDEDDEEGNCPVIVLENRSFVNAEKVEYRTKLHEQAEEEDIAERNQEMDLYISMLEEMCDIFVNNDMAGSNSTDITMSGMSSRLGIYIPGPQLQREITIMQQFTESNSGPVFGIVGGRDLRERLNVLSCLIENHVDEVMLGAYLSPLFERVKRERFIAQNPESLPPDSKLLPQNSNSSSASSSKTDVRAEGGPTQDFAELTSEEDALLPAVHYLIGKAVGKGVVIHTANDYVVGDVAPNVQFGGNYEAEYSGEVSEYIVKPLVQVDTNNAEDGNSGQESSSGAAEADDEEEEEEEEEEEIEGEAKLAPDDPRVIRDSYGMPPRKLHILDIGPSTQEAWGQELKRAKSVLWIGAIGAVEYQDFCAGSQALLDALVPENADEDIDGADAENNELDAVEAGNNSNTKPTTVLCGKHLVGALRAAGMADDDPTLVSSSSIDVMTDLICGELPGISRLEDLPDVGEDNSSTVEELNDADNNE